MGTLAVGRDDTLITNTSDYNTFTPKAKLALREIFDRLDEDMDGLLKAQELHSFQQMQEGCNMAPEIYDFLMDTFDNRDGGLTPLGFIQVYENILKSSGNCENIWSDLSFMGYDHDLELRTARTFVLSFHGTSSLQLTKVNYDSKVYEDAIELPIRAKGTPTDLTNGAQEVILWTLQSGYWGVSLAVENRRKTKVRVSLDCSQSINVVSNHDGLNREVEMDAMIEGKETNNFEVIHHLMPRELKGWEWKYQATVTEI